jgi:hypothetical protein
MTPKPITNETDPSGPRTTRTIALRPDQDRWLDELLGAKGNVSGFYQSLTDACMRGEIGTKNLTQQQRDPGVLARVTAYLKAKEASMLFEEDVLRHLEDWSKTRRGTKVSKARIHNSMGTLFIADVSIEDEKGNVCASVVCKSSPRSDRLQLALAEAMIGQQKTGKPVITVVPYFIEEGQTVVSQFKTLNYAVTDLKGLVDSVEKALKNHVSK